jgi:hypothetical protein
MHDRTQRFVFLSNVDNALLDNSRVAADLRHSFEPEVDPEGQLFYWAVSERLRTETDYTGYRVALQRYRLKDPPASHLLVELLTLLSAFQQTF